MPSPRPYRTAIKQSPSRIHALCIFAALFFLSLLAGVARADSQVSAQLLADHAPLVAGQDATLAVQMDIAPGYHAQSAKPYDKYLKATRVKLLPQDGVAPDPPQYPVAKDIPVSVDMSPGGKLAAYEGRVWILIPIHIDADAKPGSRTLQVSLQSQVCNDESCLAPTTTTLRLPVEIASAGTPSAAQDKSTFDSARQQKFIPAETQPATTTAPAATSPATAPAAAAPANPDDDAHQLAQIANRDYAPANTKSTAVWLLLIYALLGGAVLNVMPCVLPVIPLKVLSLVQQAHGNRRLAVMHGLVFSAGIIASFMALAAALGTYGLITHSKIFYGMQFNSVAFLITMSFIVLALALSMLGVWTIQTPQAVYAVDQHRHGYAGSFSMGLLATLLATPCSAPFLGGFLPWALVQPLPIMIPSLALVGVGMSVPYVVLAAFPAGLNRLPKAGRWSELLKQFFGIVMIGVAFYLLLQIPNAMLWPWAIAGAALLGAVCWAWGQIPTPAMSTAHVWDVRAVVVLIGLAGGWGLYARASQIEIASSSFMPAVAQSQEESPTVTADGPLPWRRFSIAALDHALREGRPVMVDWTADWCINCKYVEATRLQSQDVRQALAKTHAVLLRADLTDNAPGNELLAKLGSRSIPFLGIFSPAQPLHPMIFRDIYSKDAVAAAVDQAGEQAPDFSSQPQSVIKDIRDSSFLDAK